MRASRRTAAGEIVPAAMLRDASQRARIEKLERDEGAAPLLSMRAAAASVSEMGEPREESDELGLALDARLGEDRGKL